MSNPTVHRGDDRRNVMVVETYAIGMIGVVRSLGEAGYAVHAVSSDPKALGFHSRYAANHAVHPKYDQYAFLPWLRSYCSHNRIDAIVPSEGFLHAVAPAYDEFRGLIPDAPSHDIVIRCLSKVRVCEHLTATAHAGKHLPRGGVIRSPEELPTEKAMAELGGPFYVKLDGGFARNGADAGVVKCEIAEALVESLRAALASHTAVLWQAHVPGKKVGVSLWRHSGEIFGESMALGIHQQPYTGGMMSLRETFWHEAILRDAKEKLEALEWSGVAMMEYKWDPETDDFWFIEINARFWGYLHLDLYAGKPFPRLQMDAFFGIARKALGPPARGIYCRHAVPGDWGYAISKWRDGRLPFWERLLSLVGFVLRFLQPTVRSDLLFPGDRLLYFRQLGRFLGELLRKNV